MRKLIVFASAVLFLMLFCCGKPEGDKTEEKKEKQAAKDLYIPPEKFSSYENEWKEVTGFESEGKPRSALETVEKIQTLAISENNAPQLIKVLLFKTKFVMNIGEKELPAVIKELEDETIKAKFPANAILKSMLADIYWNYFNSNRYKFYNRTETAGNETGDIATWDLKTIFKRITTLYNESLNESENLKNINLSLFDEIIVKGTKPGVLRPSLYDFLAHRTVDFYSNSETQLTEPANVFEVDSEKYFSPAEEFVKIDIKSDSYDSPSFYAFNIFKDLTKHHLKNGNAEALIDVELKRIDFIKEKSILDNSEELYFKALESLEKKYSSNSMNSMILYKKAIWHYNRNDPENKWNLKTSKELCEKVIKNYKNSEAGDLCLAHISSITTKNIYFNVEAVNTPQIPFRILVNYTNVKKLFFKVVKVSREEKNNISEYVVEQSKAAKIIADKKPLQEWTVELPDDGDLKNHSTEIKIPALEKGIYAIAAGTDKKYSFAKEALFYAFTEISNLSVISTNEENRTKFLVADRESGQPVKGAEIKVFEKEYDYSVSRYVTKHIDTLKTDDSGLATYKKGWFRNSYGHKFILASKDGNELSTEFYQPYPREPKAYEKTVFFTDRAIYRPGQTVYFKGIMLKFDKEQKPEILKNKKTVVEFYDVNWQKIASLNLKSNDFGSFQGSFTAPNNVLGGNMTIRNKNGAVSFSVEEYKRPKFETNIEPVKESFKINDLVKVKGKAFSYSGAPLTDAKVSWKVERTVSYPYFYSWGYFGYQRPAANTVVAKGVSTTDASGIYEIEFKALPDRSVPEKGKPVFSYRILADVTDISGETRSTSSTVSVGYLALSVSENIPNEINTLKELEFEIATANLNGEFEPAKGIVKISKLQEPDRLLRKRLWNTPDKFLMSKEEYVKDFKSDIYDSEDDITQRKIEKQVFTAQFDTSKEKKIIIKTADQWLDGKYLVEIETKDKYGEKIEYKKYFSAYKPENGVMTEKIFNRFSLVNQTVEPGNSGNFVIGSGAENVSVIFEIQRKNKKSETTFINLNKEKKVISIPVTESDRGNIGYSIMFQKNGRAYHQSGVIQVPWTDKQLKIETLSFREKLYPGQKEEWKIKISGSKGEAVAAEMVATLYDKSLDSFRANGWYLAHHPHNYFQNQWIENISHRTAGSVTYQLDWNSYYGGNYLYYDTLNWFGNYFYNYYGYRYSRNMPMPASAARSRSIDSFDGDETIALGSATVAEEREESDKSAPMKKDKMGMRGAGGLIDTRAGEQSKNLDQSGSPDKANAPETQVQIRKNMNETAFFFPMLNTNDKGEVIISFTIPEALTKWKFMGLAHTKDLKTGIISKETVTQKDIMVMPNMPRFLREGDSVIISAKITSMIDKVISGKAELRLFDAITMKPVDKILNNDAPVQDFAIKPKENTVVNWPVKVPLGVSAVTWRIIAKSGNQGDGEEQTLPVLSNRALVTESLPLPLKPNEKREFLFKKLMDSKSSDTLVNHKLTLEFTSNPVWYAVQALPYLMEYPYECAEQIFSRFYANSLASHIANSNPNIKKVFDQWKNTDALLSNLQKNEELKSVLLAETPWVLDAQNEEQNKKRVALLFDLNRMGNELDSALKKLRKLQGYNGGWPWFQGLPESRYITQHIVSGLGKLRNLKVKEADPSMDMAKKGVLFVDNEMRKSYDWLKKNHVDMSKKLIGSMEIHYLYTRSFFTDVPVQKQNLEAYNYWIFQAKKYWLGETPYMNAMSAAALWRLGEKEVPKNIVASLKERAIYHDELGMYFKENMGGYYWYQFPIETQAVIIEAFQEVTKDIKTVDDLKTWLIKMKQVQSWKTTKATVDAVYALLMGGSNWLKNNKSAEITLGNIKVDPAKMGAKTEAGTGYFKVAWNGSDVKPEMGKVTVINPNSNPAWGAVYWQYFEQLDKITAHETPLKLEKKIFKEIQTDRGTKLEPVSNNSLLSPGDRLKVRIVLRSDRDMEFIHMKDMRAAGTEPENVLSRHKYQDGLWYYESTKDVSTDFFIERLNKGTFVFEYPLRVNLKGNFSAGITTIQCMYAPEFTAHSEGIRVEVK